MAKEQTTNNGHVLVSGSMPVRKLPVTGRQCEISFRCTRGFDNTINECLEFPFIMAERDQIEKSK